MTKSEMAYIIGQLDLYNPVHLSYEYFTKEEVEEEYYRVLKLKENERR